MEKLDGKYFENTIAALKKARGEERIQIDPAFSAKLRVNIIEKAASLSAPAGFDWADMVLKYRYVLGGVPVLAVLTIVAINALNYQVKMPANQLMTTSGGLVQNTLTTSSDVLETSAEPGLVTFSADLVMPPAEYLKKTTAASTADSGTMPVSGNQEEQPPYLFLGTNVPALKIDPVILGKSGDLQEDPQKQEIVTITVPDINYGSAAGMVLDNQTAKTDEEALRNEQSGRVEQSGTALQAPLVEQQDVTGKDTDLSLPSTVPVAPSTLTVLPEVRVQSAEYINPVEEMNRSVDEAATSQYSRALDMVMSHYLSGERIIYTGNDRAQVVQAILEGFSAKNGNLSSDYSIEVKKLEDGCFKATLFEYGKVKEVIIMALRDGKLVVVTVLAY